MSPNLSFPNKNQDPNFPLSWPKSTPIHIKMNLNYNKISQIQKLPRDQFGDGDPADITHDSILGHSLPARGVHTMSCACSCCRRDPAGNHSPHMLPSGSDRMDIGDSLEQTNSWHSESVGGQRKSRAAGWGATWKGFGAERLRAAGLWLSREEVLAARRSGGTWETKERDEGDLDKRRLQGSIRSENQVC